MAKTRLGVIFGSRSVEHEVSVITAVQLMKHVDRSRYEVVPLYVSKHGRWFTGPALGDITSYKNLDQIDRVATSFDASPNNFSSAVDVVIICCHGTMGEDGTIQGLLELAGVPYQGPGVLGSAVCMDKIITKQVLETAQLPVLPYRWFTTQDWKNDSAAVLDSLKPLKFPLYVKPANLGSSVGIERATDEKSLKKAIEIALHFDRRILVDQGAGDCIEVNASVLGFQTPRVSVLEQPVKTDEILSYADKYERGGGKKGGMASLSRRIPAPISSTLTKKIQDAAKKVFKVLDCAGVVRIDFFANPSTEEFYVNETNTIPGSMSFYLWQETGMPYPKLIDALVETAMERKKAQEKFVRSISTNILAKK
jgi:D-alanine-D-alanine ligase